MHLITALAAGVAGAASGTAALTKRGTSTPATWYSSFEGDGTSTATVTLDGNGGASVYVNELVTVTVKDSSGATVRTFTDGVASPTVEVQSASFTGTNYEDASSAAGEPTTLQTVLDAWKTSAGSTDFKVLIDSTATTLKDFAGIAAGLIFNVQAPTYAATGDGATDDAAAVQAAIDAAEAAGGGIVYFPKGTYYIDANLDIADNVTLLGTSRELSIIEMNSRTFSVAGASGKVFVLQNLAFHNTTAGSGTLLTVAGGQAIRAAGCSFGGSSNAFDTVCTGDDGDITFDDCSAYVYEALLDTTSGASGGVYRVRDCIVYSVNPSQSSGNMYLITMDGSIDLEVSHFTSDGSGLTFTGAASLHCVRGDITYTGTVSLEDIYLTGDPAGTGAQQHNVLTAQGFALAGCYIRGVRYSPGLGAPESGYPAVANFGVLPTEGRVEGLPNRYVTANDASIDVGWGHGATFVTRTDATAMTFTLNDNIAAIGDVRELAVTNTSGGTSLTIPANIASVASPVAISAGETYVFRFMRIPTSGSIDWAEIGTAAAVT